MDYKTNFNESVFHELEQYMWDNGINLPKSQKTLFIAGILLALKIDPELINDYKPDKSGKPDKSDKPDKPDKPDFIIANKIIELIECEFNDPSFTSQFKFIQKSLHNKHLFELVTKIKNTVSNYGVDVLNKFYSEFCKYDKNNDSQLGVVLTPQDIVSLMISELQIKEDHSVLDFCTGTGSFLLESSKFTKNLIGCENNEERYALCKCNFILNDLDYTRLYFNSCFAQRFDKYDRSIINPPFSTNSSDVGLVDLNETHWKEFNKEQKFLLYQVQHLKIGGMGACIIPRSNFNNTVKKTLNFKSELLKHIVINKIINLNSRVFVPVANVECAIIIYTRTQSTDSPQTSPNVIIVDYTNDGYDLHKNFRIKISEPTICEQTRDLEYTSDFNYIKDYQLPTDLIKMIQIYNIDYSSIMHKNQIIQGLIPNNDLHYEKFQLADLLELIKVRYYPTMHSESGDIPLYGAGKYNNPVKFINEYSIDTFQSPDLLIRRYGVFCINKTGDGGAGISYIRRGKFAVNSSVYCCKMKLYISLTNAAFISHQLHTKFNRSNSLNFTKFMDTEVYMFEDDIKLYDNLQISNYIDENRYWEKYEYLRIGDYFKIILTKKFQINSSESGIYPLISSTSSNNGVCKYIRHYSYNGECITVARNGSVGSSFYHSGFIAVTSDVVVLQKIKDLNYSIWAMMLNYYLPQKYSYANGLSVNKLLNEIIPIPIISNN